ncbi:hypothetical protein GLYMA_15G118350v4 [Glycine max]|nr:hypothetical protein GLYMA_15G118350v4 [Glycine max]KAH1146729.1 hypothetical protein GYH30_042087 [Glycine max]
MFPPQSLLLPLHFLCAISNSQTPLPPTNPSRFTPKPLSTPTPTRHSKI